MGIDTSKIDSKEVGLAVGLLVGEQFLGMKDLHYGFWSDGLAVEIANLGEAQKRYTDYLVSQIPSGVKRVLDVGSGSGRTAAKLLQLGFSVDCVSPSTFLTERVRAEVGDRAEIFPLRFEELEALGPYDLVLFSESFQYVDPQVALQQIRKLAPKGYFLISDFFKKTIEDGPLGGGHSYEAFLRTMENAQVEVLKNQDITAETAPTMELFGRILTDLGVPVRDLVCGFIAHRHPLITRLLNWRLKKRFNKINDKYFSGRLNGKSFSDYKTYRLIVGRPGTSH